MWRDTTEVGNLGGIPSHRKEQHYYVIFLLPTAELIVMNSVVPTIVGDITALASAKLKRHATLSYTHGSRGGLRLAVKIIQIKTPFQIMAANWRVTSVCAARVPLPPVSIFA